MEFGGHQRAGPQMAYDSNFFAASSTGDLPCPPHLVILSQASIIQGPRFYIGPEVLEFEQAAVQHC